jgi:hypothetical protein
MRRGDANGGPIRNNLKEQLEWLHNNHQAALAACFSYSVVKNGDRVESDDYQFTKAKEEVPDLDRETQLAAEAMLQEAWEMEEEERMHQTDQPLPSTERSYFPSSAADLGDDFDSLPPFFARQKGGQAKTAASFATAANVPPPSTASHKGKEKADAGFTPVEEEEEVIDLTQEPPHAGDGTSLLAPYPPASSVLTRALALASRRAVALLHGR